MSSMRIQVPAAIMALVAQALPAATVVDDDNDATAQVPPGGRAVVRIGDRGEPDIDLGLVRYYWEHRIPVELSAPDAATLDAMLTAIDAAIATNRTLDGLIDWLDADCPETGALMVERGAVPPQGTDLILIASYATATALG